MQKQTRTVKAAARANPKAEEGDARLRDGRAKAKGGATKSEPVTAKSARKKGEAPTKATTALTAARGAKRTGRDETPKGRNTGQTWPTEGQEAQWPGRLRDKALLILLYETAARPQEIRDLRWGDINWQAEEVRTNTLLGLEILPRILDSYWERPNNAREASTRIRHPRH